MHKALLLVLHQRTVGLRLVETSLSEIQGKGRGEGAGGKVGEWGGSGGEERGGGGNWTNCKSCRLPIKILVSSSLFTFFS